MEIERNDVGGADEVMSGWCRTGKWFAMGHWGFVPDILTTAKGLTNAAVSLGLCATTRETAFYFEDHFFFHGRTYELKRANQLCSLRIGPGLVAGRSGSREPGKLKSHSKQPDCPMSFHERTLSCSSCWATLASRMAQLLLNKTVYVVAFSYPVVPEGTARIRCQVSAVDTQQDLEFAVAKFGEAKTEFGM
jgi:hypothetical protein